MNAMEETGTLQALAFLARAGHVDLGRIGTAHWQQLHDATAWDQCRREPHGIVAEQASWLSAGARNRLFRRSQGG